MSENINKLWSEAVEEFGDELGKCIFMFSSETKSHAEINKPESSSKRHSTMLKPDCHF